MSFTTSSAQHWLRFNQYTFDIKGVNESVDVRVYFKWQLIKSATIWTTFTTVSWTIDEVLREWDYFEVRCLQQPISDTVSWENALYTLQEWESNYTLYDWLDNDKVWLSNSNFSDSAFCDWIMIESWLDWETKKMQFDWYLLQTSCDIWYDYCSMKTQDNEEYLNSITSHISVVNLDWIVWTPTQFSFNMKSTNWWTSSAIVYVDWLQIWATQTTTSTDRVKKTITFTTPLTWVEKISMDIWTSWFVSGNTWCVVQWFIVEWISTLWTYNKYSNEFKIWTADTDTEIMLSIWISKNKWFNLIKSWVLTHNWGTSILKHTLYVPVDWFLDYKYSISNWTWSITDCHSWTSSTDQWFLTPVGKWNKTIEINNISWTSRIYRNLYI